MGVLAAALTNLAAVTVSGVTVCSLDDTPAALTPVHLPALLILPELSRESPGLEPSGFTAGDGWLTMHIAQVLLVAPVAGGLRSLPALVDAIDATVSALAGDPTLDGALPVPLRLTVRPGVFSYAGTDYHGAIFQHTWRLWMT